MCPQGPERVLHIQDVADTSGVLSLVVGLKLPSVAVVHVCSRTDMSPGAVRLGHKIQIRGG